MEANDLARHVCKLCNKSFGSGRSLGGHMRSHLADNQDHEKHSTRTSLSNMEEEKETDFGYGHRKNPKKTQNIEFVNEGFQSWKALFGQMKCHSNSQELEEQDSHDITHSKHKLVMDIQSDNEIEHPNKRKRSTTTRTPQMGTTNSNSFSFITNLSSVFEIDQEQEVAISLMLLSMDFGNWVGFNSKFFQTPSFVESGSKISPKKNDQNNPDMFLKICKNPKKRSKFECGICAKIFHSYQALGGHRASHKKLKGCLVKGLNNGGQSEEKMGSQISKKHKCPICERVFGSGQALGGHKRSHLIQKHVPEIRGCLDLNLPPQPVERETMDHNLASFKPWWVAASQHEALVNVGFHI